MRTIGAEALDDPVRRLFRIVQRAVHDDVVIGGGPPALSGIIQTVVGPLVVRPLQVPGAK